MFIARFLKTETTSWISVKWTNRNDRMHVAKLLEKMEASNVLNFPRCGCMGGFGIRNTESGQNATYFRYFHRVLSLITRIMSLFCHLDIICRYF